MKTKHKSEDVLQRDVDYFDALVADMDEETRAAYLEWVDNICKLMHNRSKMPFGEKSAKHLIVRMADYLNYLESKTPKPHTPEFFHPGW